MDDERFRLEFDADPRYISTARLFASAVARHYGYDASAVQDLKIAISEACTNAVKAHTRTLAARPIQLELVPHADSLEVEVIDAGGGFAEQPKRKPSDQAESGIGLHIIRSLFPEAAVSPNDSGGTTVRFRMQPLSVRGTGADGAP